ncbi:MAG TPA: tetratricopeptide repeat protein [Anaerolineae bacterium]|nr:tetratricopeptide repeat protein [Ardenticatenia bacterium]MBK8539242.1 tetratricopeptide repeat protein [Ardenticatenia bacterium]HQZ71995.1 tetratricopeptide repeat protein [Anaerolineae bacterium]
MKIALRRRDLSRMVLGLLLALAAGWSWARSQATSAIARQMEAGDRAFATEAFATAQAHYGTAVAAGAPWPGLHYNLGNAAYRQADVSGARAALRQALEQGDAALTRDAWFNLGDLALTTGELDAAEEAFKAVLRADPADADAKHNLELAQAQRRRTASPTPAASPTAGSPSPGPSPTAGGTPTPAGSGTPGPSPTPGGTPTPGGSPSPGPSPSPGGSGTPSGSPTAGGTPSPAAGTPSPGASGTPSAGQGTPGTPGTPTPSGSGTPGGPPQGRPTGGATPQAGRLSPQQARQLLQAIGRKTRTLQEQLGQIYVVPGPAPRQRW